MDDFILTEEQLSKILKGNNYISDWYEALKNNLPNYDITSKERIAAFIAQCAHESANFKILKENLNYRAESLMRVWPRHFPTLEVAQQYAKQPEKIANKAYANRMGNGDESSGDGWKFCGRGLIQLTGRDNYEAFANSIMMPVDDVPEYLSTFNGAVESACWFWSKNNLNKWADEGDIKTLTKRINGGFIGLEDRIKHYKHALEIINGEHE
jgi:putative chitinase